MVLIIPTSSYVIANLLRRQTENQFLRKNQTNWKNSEKKFKSSDNTKEWTSQKTRESFIEYFENEHRHRFLASSSVVPRHEHGSNFVGMDHFQSVLLEASKADYTKIVNAQKCIDDNLKVVGHNTHHHSFFEMLATWSLCDAAKHSACQAAWDLLTNRYNLSSDQIYVTCFGGDKVLGLPADKECKDIWRSVGVSEDHISWGGRRENFWDGTGIGPCGPKSEIHYDLVGGRNARRLVNSGSKDMIEMWNLIFLEYERLPDLRFVVLPNFHVATGMGLERLLSIVQGKASNYDTDLFDGIMSDIQSLTSAPEPYRGRFGDRDERGVDTAYRIIADHIRMCTVAIGDGLLPSTPFSGASLRRVLESAARRIQSVFKSPPGILPQLVPPVIESLQSAYPELAQKQRDIMEVVETAEEDYHRRKISVRESFNAFLPEFDIRNGIITKSSAEKFLMSQDIDIETFIEIAMEKRLDVDMTDVDASRQDLQYVSPQHVNVSQQDETKQMRVLLQTQVNTSQLFQPSKPLKPSDVVSILKSVFPNLPRTKDESKREFSGKGLEFPVLDTQVLALVKNGVVTDAVREGNRCVGLFDATPFFADDYSGQVCDVGRISWGPKEEQNEFEVFDVKSCDGLILHYGNVERGTLRIGDKVSLEIDVERRASIMANHTSAHLLNFSVKEVLGQSLTEPSLNVRVDADAFTLDVDISKTIEMSDVRQLEDIVNALVFHKLPVYSAKISPSEAKSLSIPLPTNTMNDSTADAADGDGASDGNDLLPEESQIDHVTVISVGVPPLLALKNRGIIRPCSIEACSGTHVSNTGDIQAFVITDVNRLDKGTRKRITGISNNMARTAKKNNEMLHLHTETFEKEIQGNRFPESWEEKMNAIQKNLKTSLLPLTSRVDLQKRLKHIQPRIAAMKSKMEKERMPDVVFPQLVDGLMSNALWVESSRIGSPNKNLIVQMLVFSNDKYAKKGLHEAVSQSRKLNNNKPIPGFYLTKSSDRIMCLCHVPVEVTHRLRASHWMQETFKEEGIDLIGGAVNKSLKEDNFYYGTSRSSNLNNDDELSRMMTRIERRAKEIGERLRD